MIAYYENGKGQFGLIYDVANDILYSGGGQFDVLCQRQNDLHLTKMWRLNEL